MFAFSRKTALGEHFHKSKLLFVLQAPCVASEKMLIIDCKFVASRVFNLNCLLKLGLIV